MVRVTTPVKTRPGRSAQMGGVYRPPNMSDIGITALWARRLMSLNPVHSRVAILRPADPCRQLFLTFIGAVCQPQLEGVFCTSASPHRPPGPGVGSMRVRPV